MRRIFSIQFLLLCFSSIIFADTVILTNSKVISGFKVNKEVVEGGQKYAIYNKNDNLVKELQSIGARFLPDKTNPNLIWVADIKDIKYDQTNGATGDGKNSEKQKFEKFDLGNGVILEMVHIPEGKLNIKEKIGTYTKAQINPAYTVNISDFWIGKYEVTQTQWKALMDDNKSIHKGDDLPVENISWNDCQEFCKRLSQKTGKIFSLPSMSQWEYACRAGNEGKFYFGDVDQLLTEYEWYHDNAGSISHPVGQKKPNGFGLYDMLGNVMEWCQDAPSQNSDLNKIQPLDGSPWNYPDAKSRMIMGGDFFWADISFIRCDLKQHAFANSSDKKRGFRIILKP